MGADHAIRTHQQPIACQESLGLPVPSRPRSSDAAPSRRRKLVQCSAGPSKRPGARIAGGQPYAVGREVIVDRIAAEVAREAADMGDAEFDIEHRHAENPD